MKIHFKNKERVEYEAMLLRKSFEEMYKLMPYLFTEENITASNKKVEEEPVSSQDEPADNDDEPHWDHYANYAFG